MNPIEELMEHVALLKGDLVQQGPAVDLRIRQATGCYYTPEAVGRELARSLAREVRRSAHSGLSICDPFCGDGRLVNWFLEEGDFKPENRASHTLRVWDMDEGAVDLATSTIAGAVDRLGLRADIAGCATNTFLHAPNEFGTFDVVITNPPWETVKPDRRTLAVLPEGERETYVRGLRAFDEVLSKRYPEAQPTRKFAGWGTNLSRPGLMASYQLLRPGGMLGIVMPSSIFGDGLHVPLRKWLFASGDVLQVVSFSAESKHFDGMDVPFVTAIVRKREAKRRHRTSLRLAHRGPAEAQADTTVDVRSPAFVASGYRLPLVPSAMPIHLQHQLLHLPTFNDLLTEGLFWAGRELDETGVMKRLSPQGDIEFFKGKDIQRFGDSGPSGKLLAAECGQFRSTSHTRIAWRDISRPSQLRRIQATLLDAGPITGNSLGVAYSPSGSRSDLLWMLGVMSSIAFESQLRAHLATGHVSLGSLRGVRVPILNRASVEYRSIVEAAEGLMAKDTSAAGPLETAAFRAYGLSSGAIQHLLGSHRWFPDMPSLSQIKASGE